MSGTSNRFFRGLSQRIDAIEDADGAAVITQLVTLDALEKQILAVKADIDANANERQRLEAELGRLRTQFVERSKSLLE